MNALVAVADWPSGFLTVMLLLPVDADEDRFALTEQDVLVQLTD